MVRAAEPQDADERGLLIGWLDFHRDIENLDTSMVQRSIRQWHQERQAADALIAQCADLSAGSRRLGLRAPARTEGVTGVRPAQRSRRHHPGTHRRQPRRVAAPS